MSFTQACFKNGTFGRCSVRDELRVRKHAHQRNNPSRSARKSGKTQLIFGSFFLCTHICVSISPKTRRKDFVAGKSARIISFFVSLRISYFLWDYSHLFARWPCYPSSNTALLLTDARVNTQGLSESLSQCLSLSLTGNSRTYFYFY